MTEAPPSRTLRIADWEGHYETNDSRKLKHLEWVKTPNSHDSIGFCEILSHPNGMAHYGAWNLILQLASKCPIRGLLVTGKGKAHDAHSIALVTRGNEKVISEAIVRLLAIGWLEESPEMPGKSPGISGDAGRKPVLEGEERRGDKKRGEGEENPPAPPGCSCLVKALKSLKAAGGVHPREAEALDEWIALTINEIECIDDEESAEAAAWMIKQAKKAGIVARYARHVQDQVVACKHHMEHYRRDKARVA